MGETSTLRRIRLDWLITMIAAVVLIPLLVSATRKELSMNPTRQASTELGRAGFVTIEFSTDPWPPLPTGMVNLTFMPTDSRGRSVSLDLLTFEYGIAGNDQPVGSGVAERMSGNNGMFMGSAQFPVVGDWWLRAYASLGGAQGEVRFSFYVEPAQ